MVQNNCTDTMLESSASMPISPTWRSWFRDGKRLLSAEVRRVLSLGSVWVGRARSRRQLGGLDARLLKDIGKTHQESRAESQKPFWKA